MARIISTENTTSDLCTGDIWQHKMQVRGDFLRPTHGTDRSVVNDNINWRDVQRKNVVNIECLSVLQKKLMKGKALRKYSLHEKTAASVLLKLFIFEIVEITKLFTY